MSRFRCIKIVFLSCALVCVMISCSKEQLEQAKITAYEKYFSDSIMNRTFIVDSAFDNGVDITSQYISDSFVLTNTTSYYNGIITAKKGVDVYTGTWVCDSSYYNTITINIDNPSPIPTEFDFLNRQWKFTQKSFPIMKLAPNLNTDIKVLHMQRL